MADTASIVVMTVFYLSIAFALSSVSCFENISCRQNKSRCSMNVSGTGSRTLRNGIGASGTGYRIMNNAIKASGTKHRTLKNGTKACGTGYRKLKNAMKASGTKYRILKNAMKASGTKYRTLKNAMKACELKSLVVIMDDNELRWFLFEWLHHLNDNSPLTYLDIHTDKHLLTYWIRDAYAHDRHMDFIVATENPEEVLDIAETVFRNEPHRSLAALPHRSRWLVLSWQQAQLENIKGQQEHSILDNVAVVQLAFNVDRSPYPDLGQIWTFMWREKRRRQPEVVDNKSLGQSYSCVLFPNTRHGLNGRELCVLTRPSIEYFVHSATDPHAGAVKLEGALVDMIQLLSEMLNFTFSIYPPPDRANELSWEYIYDSIDNGSAHIGLAPSSISWGLFIKVEVSYPVLFDSCTGIYKKPKVSNWTRILHGLFPFSTVALLVYAGSLLFTVVLYTVISHFILHEKNMAGNANDAIGVSDCLSCCRIHTFIFECVYNLCLFTVATFNQDTMPRPRYMSARFLVGFWCLFGVIVHCLVISALTSETVAERNPLPFKNFDEMMDRRDFSWSIVRNYSIIGEIFQTSKSKTIIKLNKKAKSLHMNPSRSFDDVVHEYLKSLPDNFVFIYYGSDLHRWRNTLTHPEDHVIMEDTLFQIPLGVMFAKQSELNSIFSKEILHFYDFGYVTKLKENYSLTRQPKSKHTLERGKNEWIVITVFGVISLILSVVSGFVLIIEKRVSRKLAKYVIGQDQ